MRGLDLIVPKQDKQDVSLRLRIENKRARDEANEEIREKINSYVVLLYAPLPRRGVSEIGKSTYMSCIMSFDRLD